MTNLNKFAAQQLTKKYKAQTEASNREPVC